MNFTSSNLDLANDEMATTFIPVITIIALYMIIGLFGNPLVVYYYGCIVVQSPSYYFIVAMAVYDIIICCVSMPLEIVDLRYSYKFPSIIACKTLRFVNYFASIASGLVLIAIATDRYRKVCCPFKRQISAKMAKIITGIISFSSFCLSWPGFVIYDVQTVNISSIPGLTGYDCTIIRDQNYKFYITLYNGVCFLIFIGCIITLTVMYILIGKKLWHLKKFRFSALTRKYPNAIYSPPTSSSEIDSPFRINDNVLAETRRSLRKSAQADSNKPKEMDLTKTEEEEPLTQLTSCNTQNTNFIQEPEKMKTIDHRAVLSDSDQESGKFKLHLHADSRKKTRMLERRKKVHEKYIHLKKYTLLMLSVSMAFVISFLPYLGLTTWRTLASKYERELLNNTEIVVFSIFLRSWLIASVVNPIIYGFFNADFSEFIANRLKRICCCCKHVDDREIEVMQESSQTK